MAANKVPPVDVSAPIPQTGSTTVTGLVGVKGKDGSTVASTGNPVPVEVEQGGAVDVPLSTRATEATLLAVKNALLAQIDISTSLWTDNTGAYFVRRDSVNEGTGTITVYFTDAAGNTVTPGAGLRPLASTGKGIVQDLFDATAGGTGYSNGDILARAVIVDSSVNPPTASAIWLNLSLGTVLSTPPTGGTYTEVSRNIAVTSSALPANAAQETGGNLAAAKADLDILAPLAVSGSATIVAPGSPTATLFTVDAKGRSFLSVAASYTAGLGTGSITVEGSDDNGASWVSLPFTVEYDIGLTGTGGQAASVLAYMTGFEPVATGAINYISAPIPTGQARVRITTGSGASCTIAVAGLLSLKNPDRFATKPVSEANSGAIKTDLDNLLLKKIYSAGPQTSGNSAPVVPPNDLPVGSKGQAAAASSLPTVQPLDATGSGTLTASGQNVDIDVTQLDSASTIAVAITGTFVGTILFLGSLDGVNFFPVSGNNLLDALQSTSTTGLFIFTAAWKTLRLNASAWLSGTATINYRIHIGAEVNRMVGSLPSGPNLIGHVVADDGVAPVSTTPDASANAFDGTLVGNVLPVLVTSPFTDFQNGIRFDGVDRGSAQANQSIDCGASGVSVNGAFTLEFKFVRTKTGVQVLGGKASAAQINLQLFLDASNKLNARSEDGGSNVKTATGSTTVTLGKHDGAMSWDGSTTLWVYLDGIMVGSVAMTSILAPDTTTQFSIGKSQQTSGNGFPFAGIIDEVRLSSIDRYAGANYTPATTPFTSDANTVGLWHFDTVRGPIFTAAADEFVDFEAQEVTLTASTDTTITFAGGQVRLVRVLNYDTVNPVRVKNGAISSNTDASSDKVGVAPAANVPFGEYFPYKTTTIHLRSAGASDVVVKGFR